MKSCEWGELVGNCAQHFLDEDISFWNEKLAVEAQSSFYFEMKLTLEWNLGLYVATER